LTASSSSKKAEPSTQWGCNWPVGNSKLQLLGKHFYVVQRIAANIFKQLRKLKTNAILFKNKIIQCQG